MGRRDFAEGLLQFLSFMGWLAGGAGLVVAALLWSQDGQWLAATQLAMATVVGVAGLLAVAQVGLVVLDLAQTAREGADRLQALESALSRAPEPARAESLVPSSPASIDERRWVFLKEVDAEVAAAAGRMATRGPRWEMEMAERVLVLGTAHLPSIERAVADQADAEVQASSAVEAEVAHLDGEAREELLRYRQDVEARNGVDPHTLKRVVSVESYQGRWRYLVGGVKVVLADGTWLLAKGNRHRLFDQDPDRAA